MTAEGNPNVDVHPMSDANYYIAGKKAKSLRDDLAKTILDFCNANNCATYSMLTRQNKGDLIKVLKQKI